jgi:hypothetical protein
MKDIGKKIKLMGRGPLSMQMVTSMKEVGSKIRLRGKVFILIWMGLAILAPGKKINSMERAKNPGLMVHFMKVTTLVVKSMG